MDSRIWIHCLRFLTLGFKRWENPICESKWNSGGFADSRLCLDADSRVWVSFFGVDSRIWIYGLGFLTLGFERWENPIRQSTWIRGQPFMSGCGFAGLGFRAWIHGFRFLGFDSRIRIHGFWIPGLGVERWENPIHESTRYRG